MEKRLSINHFLIRARNEKESIRGEQSDNWEEKPDVGEKSKRIGYKSKEPHFLAVRSEQKGNVQTPPLSRGERERGKESARGNP